MAGLRGKHGQEQPRGPEMAGQIDTQHVRPFIWIIDREFSPLAPPAETGDDAIDATSPRPDVFDEKRRASTAEPRSISTAVSRA